MKKQIHAFDIWKILLKNSIEMKTSFLRNSHLNFPYSTENLTWSFSRVQKPHLKLNQRYLVFAGNKNTHWKNSQNRIKKVLLHLGVQLPITWQSSAISKRYLKTIKQSSSNSENENTFWKDCSTYDNVVFTQNHIKQDRLHSLNPIQFSTANMFEPEYQFWKQVNVRAMPKT